MVIWIVIGTSLLKPPSPLSALIFHLLSFVSCLTSPWKLQVRRVLGLGLGFYILFIHYYRVICRSSDHTMGSPLADIRTRDGLSIAVRRARNSSPPLLFHFIFPVRFSPSQSSGWASGWWPMLPPLWDSSTRWAIHFKGIVAWNNKLTRKIDQQSTL